ncbi:MAG: DtxR family transcriptional regulator [candidate division KSB1 bacterium]|nr:DtxR family transcriptional regulator [candidate division KSB1 bacterium]
MAFVTLLLFWPGKGLVWQLRRARGLSQRVLIEDALKHLYHQEDKNQIGTIESLSGALGIRRNDAANLLGKLEAQGLIHSEQNGFGLTAEGKAYALRVIRVHRLWERYFAEETGLAETRWHEEAEKREHQTTPEEAEAMATQMGNPLHDPHGDPIPTRNGELPPRRGKPLTDLPVGQLARIIHIEDEPAALYGQLVAHGLYPGMQIQLLSKSAERVRFTADGKAMHLSPVAAANVTVTPLAKDHEIEGPYNLLSSLRVGESGVVLGISKACRGMQRRRLMDLGIVPGTVIRAELRSASGDPTAYNIRGAMIALRQDQANLIHIRRQEASA